MALVTTAADDDDDDTSVGTFQPIYTPCPPEFYCSYNTEKFPFKKKNCNMTGKTVLEDIRA